jgi:hypothetical protein
MRTSLSVAGTAITRKLVTSTVLIRIRVRVVPLFNPRTDDWDTHFELDSTLTEIRGKTSRGRATVDRLRMNDSSQVEARTLWLEIQVWP